MSCNTGSTGSVGSWGRKDSPAKGNPQGCEWGEDCQADGARGLLGGSSASIPVPPPLQ